MRQDHRIRLGLLSKGQLEKVPVHDQVLRLVQTIPRRDVDDYIVTMDNFFTMPKVMVSLRELSVGVCGTACWRRGWSPFKDEDDMRFNTWYHINDKHNFLVCRWIDNAEVLLVSNIHRSNQTVSRVRKRPRETYFNRQHVLVFGTEGKKEIEIPQLVHDYNNWMYGVDLADQLIAQFKLKFRCDHFSLEKVIE